MRGRIGNQCLTSITRGRGKGTCLLLQSSFSTSSSGSGRGRGLGGSSFGDFTPAPGKSLSDELKREPPESPPSRLGHGNGRGRGKILLTDPIPNSFHSFVSDKTGSGSGSGRGGGGGLKSESAPSPTPTPTPTPTPGQPKQPIFINKKDESETTDSSAAAAANPRPAFQSNIFSTSVLSGAGRGKPIKQPDPAASQIKEENRHIRAAQPPPPTEEPRQQQQQQQQRGPSVQLSQEEMAKKAMSILSRGVKSEESGMSMGRGGGGGGGRGRGRGMGRGRGRRQREETRVVKQPDEGDDDGLYLGDNADGERLATTIGADNMNKLVEAFEEMSTRVLPSPMDDAYLDAFHTNCLIEFEPEYLVEFDNPDIDDKPPMPLRDALEKMKPFLMAYEGIQSQEEWEEVIKETMEKVPLLQKIVDYYSGPDRVTAKQQQEELERVAKTIPESAPTSVKQFANRAVLSLQSNPGWGFDRKCQFMDKLVWEVSQQYK